MRTSSIIKKLKSNCYRITKARSSLIKIFSTSKKPLCAIDLLIKLKSRGIPVNKTTIYREINFLLDQKIIRKLRIKPGKLHYESSSRAHHHYLICKQCDSILDIQHADLEKNINKLVKEIDAQKSFFIKEFSIEFYGLCTNCQQ